MRRQEFIRGAEENLGNALRAGMRQQYVKQLSRHAQLPAAKRRGDKHLAQCRLPQADILQSDRADDFAMERATQKPPVPD